MPQTSPRTQNVPCVAIILAAGMGTRFDPTHPKQLVEIGGKPVIAWSLEAFENAPEVTDTVVVVNPQVYEAVEKIADSMGSVKLRALIPGGAERSDSVRAAVEFLAKNGIPQDAKILIHDGVRPFVTPKIITDCVRELDRVNAATVAIPSTDTILLAEPATDGGENADRVAATPLIHAVPDRAVTFRAQTPQCFRFATIRHAYANAANDPDFHPTDDTRVVIDYLPGEKVAVVNGSADNIKITTIDDIPLAESIVPRAERIRRYAAMRRAGETVRGLTGDATDDDDNS